MIRHHSSIIVQIICRILIPFIQLFGVYVLFHGHYSPGGGFQAGVLIGASLILQLLIGKKHHRGGFWVRSEFLLACLGLSIFLGIGVLSLFYQAPLFDYAAIPFLSETVAMRRYWGILIAEIGVTLVVAMTLVIIFHVLVFLPEEDSSEQTYHV